MVTIDRNHLERSFIKREDFYSPADRGNFSQILFYGDNLLNKKLNELIE
jgi:hypothetical protein